MRDETTFTNVLANREGLLHPSSAPAAILRREVGGNSNYSSSGAFSLGFEYVCKSSPACITDTFREMVVFYHPFDIQVFNRNVVKLSNDIQRGFVVKVCTLPLYLLVFLSQNLYRFSSAVTSLVRSSGDSSLSSLHFLLRHSVVARIFNLLTGRKGGEGFKSDINTDRLTGLWNEAGLILFHGEDDIPPIRFSYDRTGFNRPLDLSTQAHSTRADLTQMELVAFQP